MKFDQFKHSKQKRNRKNIYNFKSYDKNNFFGSHLGGQSPYWFFSKYFLKEGFSNAFLCVLLVVSLIF
jgi:hypothetical protein